MKYRATTVIVIGIALFFKALFSVVTLDGLNVLGLG